jgi:hypothetical protein
MGEYSSKNQVLLRAEKISVLKKKEENAIILNSLRKMNWF